MSFSLSKARDKHKQKVMCLNKFGVEGKIYQKLLSPLLYYVKENKDGHRVAELGRFSMEAKEQVGKDQRPALLIGRPQRSRAGRQQHGPSLGFMEEPQGCP